MLKVDKLDGQAMTKYSICITNYNMMDTIHESMEAVLAQLDSDFEVVVCDSCSDDGSREVLDEYEREGRIKLIVQKSSRGKGRQIAFENSCGDYIISGIDTDDVVKPTLRALLRTYHDQHEGYMLSLDTIHIIPRKLVKATGGWRDMQWGEDVDFTKRVEFMSKLHYFPDATFIIKRRGRVKRGSLYKLKERFRFYQCCYRIGLNGFGVVKTSPWYEQPIQFAVALAAIAVCKYKREQKFKYSQTGNVSP